MLNCFKQYNNVTENLEQECLKTKRRNAQIDTYKNTEQNETFFSRQTCSVTTQNQVVEKECKMSNLMVEIVQVVASNQHLNFFWIIYFQEENYRNEEIFKE